ncbi:MAG: aminotransferase class V-fold PLP-dependent enzyme [Ignavibacteriales bacterium]|nr:aminotransferase class V-fold PLP-dependent enzyme [Ignavibacteriales bacterium]
MLILADSAHGIGMLDLDMKALGIDFFTSSPYKWLGAPTGVGLLYVRKEASDKVLADRRQLGLGDGDGRRQARPVGAALGRPALRPRRSPRLQQPHRQEPHRARGSRPWPPGSSRSWPRSPGSRSTPPPTPTSAPV